MCSCSQNLKPKHLLENFTDSIKTEETAFKSQKPLLKEPQDNETDCLYTAQGVFVCQRDNTSSSKGVLQSTFDDQRVFFNTAAWIQ